MKTTLSALALSLLAGCLEPGQALVVVADDGDKTTTPTGATADPTATDPTTATTTDTGEPWTEPTDTGTPSTTTTDTGTPSTTTDTGTPPGPNQAPVADAGPDVWATAWQQTGVSAAASTDPDGDPLTFSWFFVSTPGASVPALSDPSAESPTFTPLEVGSYVLGLTVDDGDLADDDQVIVNVWY